MDSLRKFFAILYAGNSRLTLGLRCVVILDISPFLRVLSTLLLLAALGQTSKLYAQNRVQIVEADSIVGNTMGGETVQKIIGDVHLRTEDMELFADIVYKYDAREMVQAFGNIEINTQTESIWADSVTYYTDIDFSELRGRVIIESDSSTLYGNSVDYRFTNKVAHFRDQIRLEDTQGTLRANTGFYFRQADSATFHGKVQLRDSLKYIEGDTLYSNRRSEYYEMHGNVFADNPENSSMLKGDYLEADSSGRRLVKGNAWLKNFKQDSSSAASADTLQPIKADSSQSARSDSLLSEPQDSLITPSDSVRVSRPDTTASSQPDTTHIFAKRILSLENRTSNDTTSTVKAYENVRIWSPDFSSVSDSARYESEMQTFELWENAKAWHEQIQLSGVYIWVQLEDGDIHQLDSYPQPFVVKQDTLIDRLNQIKGDTLKVSFNDGEIQLMRVISNSHLLRFTEENEQPDGVLELTAPRTNIYFENGELVEMKAIGQHNGSYLPESEGIAEKRLDGFSWNPDMRPQRPTQNMKPQFPPIPDEPPFELPERYLNHIRKTISPNSEAQPSDTMSTDRLRSDNDP